MRSTLLSTRAATTSPSCSSRGLPFDEMTSALSPRWGAVSRPGASARFEITTARGALAILPAAMLSAMATKLEPRPDRRIPRFFIGQHYLPSGVETGLSPLSLGMKNLRRGGRRGKPRLYEEILAEHHLAITLDDAADAVEFFSGAFQQRLRFLEFLGGNHDEHTEAHIEGAEHFFLSDVAEFLQMFKDGQNRPGTEFDHSRRAFGQHSWQVLGDAAAGNVGQRRDALTRDHLPNNRPVAAMGPHEFVADLVLDLADKGLEGVTCNFKEQFTRQRVSVSVQAIGGQTEDAIPHLYVLAADDAVTLDHSDNKSGEIVFAFGINPWHFSGLAADQGAGIMLAGFREAANNFFGDFRVQPARGQVVHKKQRRRTLHGDVVHAVIHQIGADGVVHFHFEGHL